MCFVCAMGENGIELHNGRSVSETRGGKAEVAKGAQSSDSGDGIAKYWAGVTARESQKAVDYADTDPSNYRARVSSASYAGSTGNPEERGLQIPVLNIPYIRSEAANYALN